MRFKVTMSDGCNIEVAARSKGLAEYHAAKILAECGPVTSVEQLSYSPDEDRFATQIVPPTMYSETLIIPTVLFGRFIDEVLNPIEEYVRELVVGHHDAQIDKIALTKAYRDLSGMGLKEAKDAVEGLIDERARNSGVDFGKIGEREEAARDMKYKLESAFVDTTPVGFDCNLDDAVSRGALFHKIAKNLAGKGYKIVWSDPSEE